MPNSIICLTAPSIAAKSAATPNAIAGQSSATSSAANEPQVDPLRLGPIVDVAGHVLRSDATPYATLFAIGPVSRAAFWEITTIPDSREQVARITEPLAKAEQFALTAD